jgi:GNAT superfamily N-acetyltransferase
MQIPQQPISIRIPGAGTIRVANDAAGPDAMECVRWDPGTELDEPFAIRDGRVAYLRSITPAARPLIKAAMKKLSPETSRRRFFTVRHELSEAELDRMTNLDGWNQYAIGAVSVDADGCTEGVGVARWARDADDPRSADFALLVVDGWQHQGLGSALLLRLVAIAASRGIERFVGSVLSDNTPMFALIEHHAPLAVRTRGRDFDTVEFTLESHGIRFAA